MLFFPFRADIRLSRFPLLTILISLLCLFIYWQQVQSNEELMAYTQQFCNEQTSRKHKVIMQKLADAHQYKGEDICRSVFMTLNYVEDRESFIKEMAAETSSFTGRSLIDTHNKITVYIYQKLKEYDQHAPDDLSNLLSYKPDSYNPLTMISSAFAHGSWSHVIGNLFFFFAFAATVEAILGVMLFPVVIIALAIGTNLVYSLSLIGSADSIATLGLSGVVYGVMGLFIYFIPHARIRCFFWFIIIFRKFGLPAWLLAGWYFGWDLFALFQHGNAGGVNLVAHVSGFIEGYLIGLLLFRWRKQQIRKELQRSESREQLAKVLGS